MSKHYLSVKLKKEYKEVEKDLKLVNAVVASTSWGSWLPFDDAFWRSNT